MKPNGRKKLNIVLATLLVLAVAVLLAVWFTCGEKGAVSPDNYIRTESRTPKSQPAPASDASIEIYRANPSEQLTFSVDNMLPGDSVEKVYTINVSHKGGVKLFFSASLQDDSNAVLAQGLYISVTRSGENLYDGTFAALSADPMVCTLSAAGADTREAVPFIIKVYLPTSAGNEYQNKLLTADFKWWLSDVASANTDNDTPSDTETLGQDTTPGTYTQIAQTGDTFPLVLFCIVCAAALAGLIFLFLLRRKKDTHERK